MRRHWPEQAWLPIINTPYELLLKVIVTGFALKCAASPGRPRSPSADAAGGLLPVRSLLWTPQGCWPCLCRSGCIKLLSGSLQG